MLEITLRNFLNCKITLIKRVFKKKDSKGLLNETNRVTKEQSVLLCRYENYVFKELANYPLSCKMEPLLSPLSVSHTPFQTKRRKRTETERDGGRKRERERKGERLNGPLDQNDSCEEGSENKQGFRELLAALAEAITIIIIVIMFTVIICCLRTASP